jgi:quercetin dioxygenase-like cupin family protein
MDILSPIRTCVSVGVVIASVVALSFTRFAAAEKIASQIQIETLSRSTSSWDGVPYKTYPSGPPELTILKITIAPHTTMRWHTHPIPSVGYILSGELTVEKKDGTKRHFLAGQVVTETVDSVHRGVSGPDPTVLIVFYSGTPDTPLSQQR